MIHVHQVSKYYDNATPALVDVSFKINKGDFVFITGPSGAGKTTLLRHIFGAEKPNKGQILIKGINLNRINQVRLDRLRRKMGFVFQDFKLLHRKTVYQNVALAVEVAGERPAMVRKKTRQALKSVGLTGKEQAFPMELSGGEQQRVAIARAIVNDPIIILADEPTGNLDPDITREIMILFRSINLRGTTVVIVTHSTELLKDTDQRIIHLNRGRIVSEQGI